MIEVAVVRSAARGIVARIRMVGVVVGTIIVVTKGGVATMIVLASRCVIGIVVIVHAMIIHGTVVFRMNNLRATVHARLAHLGTEVAHAATEVAAAAKVPEAAAEMAAAKPATETAAAREGVGCQTKSAKRNCYGQCDS